MSISTPVDKVSSIPYIAAEKSVLETNAALIKSISFVGQKLEALVVSVDDSGAALVKTTNGLLKLTLAPNLKPGDIVSLSVVQSDPHLSVAVSQVSDKYEPTFSNFGKTISNFSKSIDNNVKTSLPFLSPLLAQTDEPIAQSIAKNLEKTISQSGAFYESHLQKIAEGSLPVSTILLEPQAKFKPHDILTEFVSNTNQQASSASDHITTPSESLKQIVSAQLHILDKNEVQFNGLAWQGQPVNIVLSKEQHEAQSPRDVVERDKTWFSTINISTPALGDVKINISLTGKTISIKLNPEKNETRLLLNNNSERLKQSLDKNGLFLTSLTTEHG